MRLARAEGRELKFCSMEPGVRLGAEIHESESSALLAFAHG